MSDFTIRSRTPEDDEAIVVIYARSYPDRPPMTVEELRHRTIGSQPANAFAETVVCVTGEAIAGYAGWNRLVYVEEQDSWWSFLLVDPDRRGQGFGSALYDVLINRMGERKVRTLTCQVRENSAHSMHFVEKRGFIPNGQVLRHSRLEVNSVNLARSQEAAVRVKEAGVRINTLTELDTDDAFLHGLYRVSEEAETDMPSSEPYAGMPFEDWCKDMFHSPGTSHETIWVAIIDGQPVGFTCLTERAGGFVESHFTAVARSHRGRGIARALKLQTVEWAQRNGVRAMLTGNDLENAPMLAINVDLGYRLLPAAVEMVKKL
ncbi:MAG: GNAT family N-acetyltransferase [Chloroflexota bacterium]